LGLENHKENKMRKSKFFGFVKYGSNGYVLEILGKEYGFYSRNRWEALKSGLYFWWINY